MLFNDAGNETAFCLFRLIIDQFTIKSINILNNTYKNLEINVSINDAMKLSNICNKTIRYWITKAEQNQFYSNQHLNEAY